jgi:hypothetical protein
MPYSNPFALPAPQFVQVSLSRIAPLSAGPDPSVIETPIQARAVPDRPCLSARAALSSLLRCASLSSPARYARSIAPISPSTVAPVSPIKYRSLRYPGNCSVPPWRIHAGPLEWGNLSDRAPTSACAVVIARSPSRPCSQLRLFTVRRRVFRIRGPPEGPSSLGTPGQWFRNAGLCIAEGSHSMCTFL